MTNEEAKEILEEVKDLDDSMYQYISAYEEALDMAIKALEQEPKTDVLDKIRAEIDKLPDLNPDYEMDKTIHVSKWSVFDIIDKYKAESEVDE